jgi:hypothetical protein
MKNHKSSEYIISGSENGSASIPISAEKVPRNAAIAIGD